MSVLGRPLLGYVTVQRYQCVVWLAVYTGMLLEAASCCLLPPPHMNVGAAQVVHTAAHLQRTQRRCFSSQLGMPQLTGLHGILLLEAA